MGHPVHAEDFKASWLELLNPAQHAEYSVYLDVIKGAESYRKGNTQDPNSVGIRVLEDKILEVELEKPTSHFLKLLCILSFSPIHPSYLNKKDWDKKAPLISNGPFFLYQRKDNEFIMKKNVHYWDKEQVTTDGVRILFYDDPKQIALDFNEGKIHWTSLNDCDYEALEDESKAKIEIFLNTCFIYYNSSIYRI